MRPTKPVLVEVPIDLWKRLQRASFREGRGAGRILLGFAMAELLRLPIEIEPLECREDDDGAD